MSDSSLSPEHEKAEIARLQAEEQKHLAEAKELNRPIIRRPAFWGALIPGLAAVIAASVAFNSDLWEARETAAAAENKKAEANLQEINAQKLLLEAESVQVKYDLQLATAALAQKEKEFAAQTKQLEKDFAAREKELKEREDALKQSTQALVAQLADLVRREDALNKDLEALEKEKAALGVERDALVATNEDISAQVEVLQKARDGLEADLEELQRKLNNAGLESAMELLAASTKDAEFEERHAALRAQARISDDRAKAAGIIFARAGETDDLWQKTGLLGAGLSALVDKDEERFAEFLSTGIQAAGAWEESEYNFWEALELRQFDWETPDVTVALCLAMVDSLVAAGDAPSARNYLSGGISQCAGNGTGRDLSDEDRLMILEPLLTNLVPQILETDPENGRKLNAEVFRAADIMTLLDPKVADVLMAAWLHKIDHNLDDLGLRWLEDYVEEGFTVGEPSSVGSVKPEDWAAFWDAEQSNFQVETLLELMRGE